MQSPCLVAESGLPVGHNGRVKIDRHLRALDHPDIYVAGDLASVTDPETGHALPPTAQIALQQGETVANNLLAEVEGRDLEPFTFLDKGFVVSIGARRGVAEVAGRAVEGRLAQVLKKAIEWEYRQSVKHLRGWSPMAAVVGVPDVQVSPNDLDGAAVHQGIVGTRSSPHTLVVFSTLEPRWSTSCHTDGTVTRSRACRMETPIRGA